MVKIISPLLLLILSPNLLFASGLHDEGKYLKDISSVELLERTVEQWQHIGVETEKYQDYLSLLQQIWPNINKGDTLSLIFDKRSSAFYYNQELIGIVDSPQFGQLFIDIWLAKNTSQPNLRKELLGEHTQQEVNNG